MNTLRTPRFVHESSHQVSFHATQRWLISRAMVIIIGGCNHFLALPYSSISCFLFPNRFHSLWLGFMRIISYCSPIHLQNHNDSLALLLSTASLNLAITSAGSFAPNTALPATMTFAPASAAWSIVPGPNPPYSIQGIVSVVRQPWVILKP